MAVTTLPVSTEFKLTAGDTVRLDQACLRLPSVELIESSLAAGEGILSSTGALVVQTGKRTGRSPKDRFIVREPETAAAVDWGKFNQPCSAEQFDRILTKVVGHLQQRRVFVNDGLACADPTHQLRVRVCSTFAWQALFARNLFLRPTAEELATFVPDWHILVAPGLHCDPARDGTNSEAFISIHFSRRLVVIAGTQYGGEIKKSVFSILNYLLPQRGVFPMHCSANVGQGGESALFFGLSGTGKTTLSADPERRLIGDDEHGWSESGIFNIEGGCYAKTIRLSAEGEPQIWNAIRFGAVLENVILNPLTREPDYVDASRTENTRAAYPVDFIPNCDLSGRAQHPHNVVFLTCDAFGVMPPLAKLTHEQAMYHFLAGYTAKVAGTEAGVTEPEATFSSCFGAPFLPLHPTRYAEMLKQKLEKHRCPVWLVNTGWTGGGYGTGRRMNIGQTRALLRAALTGILGDAEFDADPVFGVLVPRSCPEVHSQVLQPRRAWADTTAYDTQSRKLARLFRDNFQRFAERAGPEVQRAGPKV
jgi:phosphoenolpyruvate carboxykinase (ATP)